MRILRITPGFAARAADSRAPRADGVAIQAALLCEAVSEADVEQHVLTIATESGPSRATSGPRITLAAVGSPAATGTHRRHVLWLRAVIGELNRLRRRPPDIVHVHGNGLVEPLLAAIAARLVLRVPLVLTLHCSAIATYVPRSRKDAIVQVVTRGAERLAISLSAQTLTLTERAAARLGSRVSAMPDVVDPRIVRALESRTSADWTEDHRAPRVLYLGRVSAEKGWPMLSFLLLSLSDMHAHLVVCGDGPDLDPLRAELATAADDSRFTVAGPVHRRRVPDYLAAADVLVLPSEHEELGSVLLEAQAAGVPVVAFAVGGVSEAFVDGRTGLLVEPGDSAAFAAAVRRALTDDALRASAAREGPARIRDRHDAQRAGRRLVELYRGHTASA